MKIITKLRIVKFSQPFWHFLLHPNITHSQVSTHNISLGGEGQTLRLYIVYI